MGRAPCMDRDWPARARGVPRASRANRYLSMWTLTDAIGNCGTMRELFVIWTVEAQVLVNHYQLYNVIMSLSQRGLPFVLANVNTDCTIYVCAPRAGACPYLRTRTDNDNDMASQAGVTDPSPDASDHGRASRT